MHLNENTPPEQKKIWKRETTGLAKIPGVKLNSFDEIGRAKLQSLIPLENLSMQEVYYWMEL